MTVGKNILDLRRRKGISQEELANLLLISRQTVSQWENDQTIPTVENFMRLCEIFKLTMNDFFEQNVVAAQKESPEAEERYVFKYTESDIDKALFRLTKGKFAMYLYAIAFMVFVIVAGRSSNAVFIAKIYLIVDKC